jgi:hypothetical protein
VSTPAVEKQPILLKCVEKINAEVKRGGDLKFAEV